MALLRLAFLWCLCMGAVWGKQGPLLTITSVLKEVAPFPLDHDLRVVRPQDTALVAAVTSWLELGDRVAVLGYGSQPTCAYLNEVLIPALDQQQRVGTSYANRFACMPVPCTDGTIGAPRWDCVIKGVAAFSKSSAVMYTNSDIVFPQDVVTVTEKLLAEFDQFLAVGQRRDFEADPRMWSSIGSRVYQRMLDLTDRGTHYTSDDLHSVYGIDYYLLTTRTAQQLTMPPVLIGRVRGDNWFVAHFLRDDSVTTVDLTPTLAPFHFNHGKAFASKKRMLTDHSKKLAEGEFHRRGKTDSTALVLSDNGEFNPRNRNVVLVLYEALPYDATDYYGKEKKIEEKAGNQVVVIPVNKEWLPLALNLYCSLMAVRNSQEKNGHEPEEFGIIFHALDKQSFRILSIWNYPVFYTPNPEHLAYGGRVYRDDWLDIQEPKKMGATYPWMDQSKDVDSEPVTTLSQTKWAFLGHLLRGERVQYNSQIMQITPNMVAVGTDGVFLPFTAGMKQVTPPASMVFNADVSDRLLWLHSTSYQKEVDDDADLSNTASPAHEFIMHRLWNRITASDDVGMRQILADLPQAIDSHGPGETKKRALVVDVETLLTAADGGNSAASITSDVAWVALGGNGDTEQADLRGIAQEWYQYYRSREDDPNGMKRFMALRAGLQAMGALYVQQEPDGRLQCVASEDLSIN
eukprot:Clim_evm17s168 gene=Clim_evmTU17s168